MGVSLVVAALFLTAALPVAPRRDDVPARVLRLAALARGMDPIEDTDGRPVAPAGALAAFYEPRDVAVALRMLDGLTPRARDALAGLLDAVATAGRLRARAYRGIGPGEIAFARSVALGAAGAQDGDVRRALGIVRRIDMDAMFRAATIVVNASRDALRAFASEPAPREAIVLPQRTIVIGSGGDDVHNADAQVLIDPSGDDTYRNNAGGVLQSQAFHAAGGCVLGGGTTGHAPPNIGCTPLPSWVCTHELGVPNHDPPGTGDGRDGSCGSDARRDALVADTAAAPDDHDSRAVSVLLDAGGDDTYAVEWSHDDPLFDLIAFCFPDDTTRTNTNRDLFQGGTLAGIGLLWDDGPGDNTFRGRLNAQGSGHVGGIGMLLSTGGGDDLYWADRLSQGSGIAGGVGILADTGGNDTYLLEPPVVYRNEFRPGGRECNQEGRAGQGQGGFGGVGVLWNEGAATYRAVTHVTSAASPYAPVLDDGGDPVLVPGTDAQGSGESFPIPGTPGGVVLGVGVLVDRGGPATVCAGAGKVAGASHVTRTPGAVDRACGRFNLPPEIAVDDLGTALEHLSGGAVGVRVVMG